MSNGDCAVCVEREQRRAFAKAACGVCKRDLTDHVDRYVSAFGPLSCWRCQARMEEARADALESELATLRASARPGEGAPEVTTKHMGAYAQLYVPGQCVLAMSDRDNPQAHDDVERAAISLRGWLSQWWPTPTAWERRAREAERDLLLVAQAMGYSHAPDTGPDAPAPTELLVEKAREHAAAHLAAHELHETIERLESERDEARDDAKEWHSRYKQAREQAESRVDADVPRRIEAAVEAEREACAKECWLLVEPLGAGDETPEQHAASETAAEIARRIRSRTRAATPAGGGETKEPVPSPPVPSSPADHSGHPSTCPACTGRAQADPPKRPHLIDGEFQSDKYPTCPRGKVPLSVKDATAQDLLWTYAQRRRAVDAEFADDLEEALRIAGYQASAQAAPPKPEATREAKAEDVEDDVVREEWKLIDEIDRSLRKWDADSADYNSYEWTKRIYEECIKPFVRRHVTRERSAARAEALEEAAEACRRVMNEAEDCWGRAGASDCVGAIRALGRDETKETK